MKHIWLLLVLFCSAFALSQDDSFQFTSSEYSNLLKKAKSGHIASQLQLGLAYQYGNGVSRDLPTAELWLRTAAGFGNPEAEVQLGMLYLQPGWRESHAQEAMKWFLRAAASGYAPAEHNIAVMYLRGWGTRPDKSESIRWFRKAADHGLLRSRIFLGVTLTSLNDWDDQVEGFKILKEGARKKNPEAMNALGYCYELGLGTAKDMAEAVRWYKRGADAGNPDSMHNLGVLHEHGNGVAKDFKEAFRWYRRGCEQGEANSCLSLANAYWTGQGTESDPKLAYQFALIADLNSKLLDQMEARISEQEKAEAAVQAKRWQIAHAMRLSTLPQ